MSIAWPRVPDRLSLAALIRLLKNNPPAERAFDITGPHFGADPTGVADSTAAIQAAIDAARPVNGTVYYPAGVYKTSATLLFDSYVTHQFESRAAATITTTALIAFQARGRGVAITARCGFIKPSIEYAGATPRVATSVGIDLSDVSFCTVDEPTIRAFERGIVGGQSAVDGPGAGYYVSVYDPEIANCAVGCDLPYAANAWKILGGRFNSNTVAGVRLTDCVGNSVRSTFEHNGIGILAQAGALEHEFSGNYFEANDLASIKYLPGARHNLASGNQYSNGTDAPIDLDGSNADLCSKAFGYRAPAAQIGGRNLLPGGGGDVDTDADGLGDGWTCTPNVPVGLTPALDTSTRRGGTGAAQRFTIGTGGTSQRSPALTATVEPGIPHVFSAWVRVDQAGAWALRVGDTLADAVYFAAGLDDVDEWIYLRQPFTPTTNAVQVYAFMRSVAPGVTRSVWVDEAMVQRGGIPTAFQG